MLDVQVGVIHPRILVFIQIKGIIMLKILLSGILVIGDGVWDSDENTAVDIRSKSIIALNE